MISLYAEALFHIFLKKYSKIIHVNFSGRYENSKAEKFRLLFIENVYEGELGGDISFNCNNKQKYNDFNSINGKTTLISKEIRAVSNLSGIFPLIFQKLHTE